MFLNCPFPILTNSPAFFVFRFLGIWTELVKLVRQLISIPHLLLDVTLARDSEALNVLFLRQIN